MYNDFARIYDKLQPDSIYEKFADYIEKILRRGGVLPPTEKTPAPSGHPLYKRGLKKTQKTPIILDLACGTGRLTALLANRGYDMIGIDISAEALELARERVPSDTLLLQQDMTSFELYGTVDAIVCCFDSVNYITNLRDLKKCFKLCENYLNTDGLLIFDINTTYKFEKILADNTFIYDYEDIFCAWENNYSKGKNEFHLTFFEKQGELFQKFEETHIQRCYEMKEIKNIFEDLKMSILDCYHEFSFKPYKKNSERVFFVAEKK